MRRSSLSSSSGVLDGSGGRLSDAAQEVDVLTVVARPRVEHVDEADDPVAADEGDAQLTLVPVLGHVLPLLIGEVRVVQARDGHGLPGPHGQSSRREAVDVEHMTHDAGVQALPVGADETAELVVLKGEDVAVGGADRVPETLGQSREDRLQVVCLRGDRAQLDDVAKHHRPLFQLLHEEMALECAGERLRGASQEAQVLREVPLPRVVDVEQAEELVVDHQRQADFAGEAVVVVGRPLVLAQLRVVGAGDDQDLVVEHRPDRGGVALQVERAAQHGLVVAAAVEAGDAAQRPIDHAVDIAVRRVHRAEDPFGDRAHERVEVARAADEGAQLHEFVEDPVAPFHLLEQRSVVECVGRHLSQPADEVQVFGEVARLVVGQLHHAEHVPVRHQRHRQLRLVAPFLQRVAAFSGEDGVVQRPGDDDLSGLDGAPAAGVAAQGQNDPLPFRVEPPAVVADEAAQACRPRRRRCP